MRPLTVMIGVSVFRLRATGNRPQHHKPIHFFQANRDRKLTLENVEASTPDGENGP